MLANLDCRWKAKGFGGEEKKYGNDAQNGQDGSFGESDNGWRWKFRCRL